LTISLNPTISALLGFPMTQSLVFPANENPPPHRQITAEKPPNMNLNTMSTVWIMCDVIEMMDNMGDDGHYPVLRAVAGDRYSGHGFSNPQFRRLTTPRIERIKIRLLEDLVKGTILDIHGPVHVRLEFRRHVD
jgi:hypothetical protein